MSRTILRRATVALAFVVAALVASACGSDPAPVNDDSVVALKPAKDSPPELKKLVRQANRLLDGGPNAFEVRLTELRGYPVVVNQWASWCGPCRAEFPFFQRLARKYEGRVGFLGVNSQDARGDAERFLREFPVRFPHYYDKDALVARVFGGGRAWPTTAYYTADGELANTHLGAYATQAKLDEDIRRYALRG
jgi:cytochrome c biogenesis protein CcmG, thiol:disulfide interchange protein DsbE